MLNIKRCSSLAVVFLTSGVASSSFSQDIEEMIVVGVVDTSIVRTEDTLVAPPDTATLLKKMPGANVNKNGELTGIVQYRGLSGDRVNVSINGAHISSGGPNAMDSPLHYAPVALLESLTITRGITPVSNGQETLGGSVEAENFRGDFTDTNELQINSRVYAGAQSVNNGSVASGLLTLANSKHIVRASLLHEEGADSDFAKGTIRPSEYERERFDLGYGLRTGQHQWSIDFARNETGNAGTAALPMDIRSVDSNLVSSKYQWQGEEFSLTAKLSFNDIEHWMTNFHLRRPPQGNGTSANPMLYRQAYATSENSGFSVQLEQTVDNGLWRYGVDGHFSGHDALITNPNAGPFFIDNFKDVQRDILGVFLERELAVNDAIGIDAGVRINQIKSDAGDVAANLNPMNATMGMPFMMNNMVANLATRFNAQNLSQTQNNVDWFTRLNYESSNDLTWYFGLARKSRAASYQERYLWLPLESTGGLADGRSYIGNVNLDSEIAHEVELGVDFNGRTMSIYPRIFYKDISDYIQGTASTDMPANTFAQMMVNMGMGQGTPLQFNNVEAKLYGFDIESVIELSSHINLRVNVSSVRGERKDVNDDLYRISPDNALLALDYSTQQWTASIEAQAYRKQDKVSLTNSEQVTAGYTLVNAFARIYLAQDIELGFGVNNLFDKNHKDHLAGYNRAFNSDIAQRERLPGLGRNIYGRFIWNF